MEWKGIDLSGSAKRKWVLAHYKSIKNILLIFFFTIGISVAFTVYSLQKKQEITSLAEEINQLDNQILTLKNKITQLQSNNNILLPFVKTGELEKYLNLIERLPLPNGGIESIQIYLESELYLKISGNIKRQEDFQKLEQYLNNQNFIEIKTDHINLNQHNETNFILSLKYKGE